MRANWKSTSDLKSPNIPYYSLLSILGFLRYVPYVPQLRDTWNTWAFNTQTLQTMCNVGAIIIRIGFGVCADRSLVQMKLEMTCASVETNS